MKNLSLTNPTNALSHQVPYVKEKKKKERGKKTQQPGIKLL